MSRRISTALLAGVLVPWLAFALAGCKPPTQAVAPAAVVKPAYDKVLANTNAAIASGEATVKGPIQGALLPVEM
eukprot:gene9407-12579_t